MGLLAAWTATVEAFREVFTWKTGGRTKDENSLRAQAERADANFQAAMDSGDVDRINAARTELRRVSAEALAKS